MDTTTDRLRAGLLEHIVDTADRLTAGLLEHILSTANNFAIDPTAALYACLHGDSESTQDSHNWLIREMLL